MEMIASSISEHTKRMIQQYDDFEEKMNGKLDRCKSLIHKKKWTDRTKHVNKRTDSQQRQKRWRA
jgi:hypothetical protein